MELTTKEKRVIVRGLIAKRETAIDDLLFKGNLIHGHYVSGEIDYEKLNSIEQRELTLKEWKIFLSMPIRILQWVVESFTSKINKRYCQLSTEQEALDEMWRTFVNENKVSVLQFIFGFEEEELKEYFAGQISMIYKKNNL